MKEPAFTELPAPEQLIRELPVNGSPIAALVLNTRKSIQRILNGEDDRLLVVMGPCSIHDPEQAIVYAQLLRNLREQFEDSLQVVMRVYFEKPRTTLGWKGLINDPHLDGSFRIVEGLRIARQVLMDINGLGVPAACEFLDVISPQYIADLISWGAIGARTTESQVHRELASGISAPVGFKNGTDGNVRIATDAILAAAGGHHFLSVHKNGQVAAIRTEGNPHCHVILRGGRAPNYDAKSVGEACQQLEAAKLPPRLMIDCSHANSAKQHRRQLEVARSIAEQVGSGSRQIFGVMVESNLNEGSQKFTPGQDAVAGLEYGVSITDACIGMQDSGELLQILSHAVKKRRSTAVRDVPARADVTALQKPIVLEEATNPFLHEALVDLHSAFVPLTEAAQPNVN